MEAKLTTRALTIACLVVTAGVAAACGGSSEPHVHVSEAAPPLPSASIVFARGEDLFIASSDGSQVRPVVRHAGQPAVSPDARRIAFVRARSVWVANRDGSSQTRLTSANDDGTPAWSPDGATIYFSRLAETEDEHGGYAFARAIFRMRADGSGVRQLTHPEPHDHGTCHESPSPSPDGRRIALTTFTECDRGYGVGISAIDRAGNPAELGNFDDAGAGFDPAWSPDGRRLAFVTVDEWETSSGIAAATSAGAPAVRVHRGPASDPAWSPDGQWIALKRGSGATGAIWLVRRDGSGIRRVTKGGSDADPAWLPEPR